MKQLFISFLLLNSIICKSMDFASINRQLVRQSGQGTPAKLEQLLKQGANINDRNAIGYTALHWAIENQKEENVQFLLSHGADVNRSDAVGSTPLHWSVDADYKSLIIVYMLLEHGARVNQPCLFGRNPLDVSFIHRNLKASTLLLSRDAVRSKNYEKKQLEDPENYPSGIEELIEYENSFKAFKQWFESIIIKPVSNKTLRKTFYEWRKTAQ